MHKAAPKGRFVNKYVFLLCCYLQLHFIGKKTTKYRRNKIITKDLLFIAVYITEAIFIAYLCNVRDSQAD